MNPKSAVIVAVLSLGLAPLLRADGGAQAPGAPGVEMEVPRVVSWVPPAYPPAALAQGLDGRVKLRIILDETGAVTAARALHATDSAFADAAVAAVRQWKFTPAKSDGRAVAKCVDFVLPFRRADRQPLAARFLPPAEVMTSLAYAPYTPPTKIGGSDPDYPDSLLDRHLKGEVDVEFSLAADGGMQGLKVLWATHADFIRPALAAAESWRFRPGMQGDLAVAAPMQSALEFDVLEAKPVDMLQANGITLADAPAGALDAKPRVHVLVDPVYPYDQRLAGAGGDGVVGFVIGTNGRAESIVVREAAQPEFGRALAAAVDCWIFRPAQKDGAAVAVPATVRWRFGPDTEAGRATARLVGRLRANDTADMGARGLDGRLNPRYQIAPVYPGALQAEKAAGQAQVSFVVDRDGRCRLARIVSASREEFGWAAATAVERWVFDPPRRGGRPTDVRVEIPFEFSAPP